MDKKQRNKGKQQKLYTQSWKQDGFSIFYMNGKDRKNLEQLYKSQNKKSVHIQANCQGQGG